MNLLQKVNNAYMNALQNTYNLDRMSPAQVAADMVTFDADLESEDLQKITECVESIQKRRQING